MVTKKKTIKDKGNGRFDVLSDKHKGQLLNLYSVAQSRSALGDMLGQSYKGNRDLYKALGLPKNLQFKNYWAYYTREGIATKIVDAVPEACWQLTPEVKEESKQEETKFEREWEKLVDEKKIWHYLARIDKLSGIGEFGILLLGFDGEGELNKPVERATKLLYLRPYKQDSVVIKSYVKDKGDERYGLPEFYDIRVATSLGDTTNQVVHWTRVLHVAEGLTEDDILGIPRMRNVYNLLSGLLLVSGGSGEMFWRGAFPGLAFILDKDAEYDPEQSSTNLEDEVNNYIHDLQRTMKLQGMDIKNLAPQVADPSKHIDSLLTLIAAARGIPKRILMGSERGELASSQDETAWNKKVQERQTNYLDPMIIRPFINRLIGLGVLPKPGEGGYVINFPDISVPTEEEEAKVAKTKSETLAIYSNALGAQEIVPPEIFLKEVMKFSEDVIKKIITIIGDFTIEEDDEEEEVVIKKEGGNE